jgi:hypothetical protein
VSEQEELIAAATSMRVVRGSLDDDELAALVAGVVAMSSAGHIDDDPGSPTSAWMDRSRTLRGARVGVLGRGGSAWRHSLR